MALGLRTNSASFLLRLRIESSAIGRWYLISLVTHINWHEFLWKSLASTTLQQFQVRSNVDFRELKCLSLWRPPPNTLKTKTSSFFRSNNRAKFDYSDGIKTLLYFRFYGLMICIFYNNMLIEKFQHYKKLTKEICITLLLHRITLSINISENYVPES